jgi:hypothetical protein
MVLKKLGLPVLALVVVAAGVYYFVGRSSPLPLEFGVPIYPGAEQRAGGSFSARLPQRDRERLVKAVILQTDDPPAKVIQFYKERLGGKTRVLEMQRHGQPTAIFQTEAAGKLKMIMISGNEDTNKTEIRIGNAATNPE